MMISIELAIFASLAVTGAQGIFCAYLAGRAIQSLHRKYRAEIKQLEMALGVYKVLLNQPLRDEKEEGP